MTLRALYAKARYFERNLRIRLLRRLGYQKWVWSVGLNEEYEFWERSLADGARGWDPAALRERTNPELELQDELKALIAAAPGETVRILDVGAGPLTTVGKRWAGRSVEVVPVDPLADTYDALLSRLKITPPARTIAVEGERLLERVSPSRFDLATAFNALDHSYDPVTVIRQMVGAVKPGCHVYLWHVRNVADLEHNRGLHQWNFDIQDRDMVIRGQRTTHSLASALTGVAVVNATFDREARSGLPVVVTIIRRIEACE